jgi:hypothetical protein
MNEFIAERLKLIRQLADKADPFTKKNLPSEAGQTL